MHELANANETADFIKQICLIEFYKGVRFLSAASLMGKIGDFSVFQSLRQLFAYLGLNSVVLHTMDIISISKNRDGSAKNSVLRDSYLKRCQST